MASDIFLKLDGIDGEAQDEKHKDEIEVLSYSFGVTNAGTGGLGKGSGAAKADFSDLSITKHTDKASPGLFVACASGKHIASGTLTVRKAGGEGKAVEYLKVKLTEVFVSHFSGSESGQGGIGMDSVSLNFSKIEVTYTPQGAEGGGEGDIVKSYDLKQNKAA